MKHYLIPYFIGQQDDWWGGINFYNHSSNETAVNIRIQRPNGTTLKSLDYGIGSFNHCFMGSKDFKIGRCSVFINCSDDVFFSPFMGKGDFFIELKFVELEKN